MRWDGTARDRPSPYDTENAPEIRIAGALGCHTRIRAGFPRNAADQIRIAGALGCHTRIREGFPRDATPYKHLITVKDYLTLPIFAAPASEAAPLLRAAPPPESAALQ